MQEMYEMQVWSLGWEDPLENEMATRCSILAWRTPWTEEAGGLQSMGSHGVGHDCSHLAQHILAQGHRRLPLREKARHSQLKPGQFMDAEVAKEEEAVTLGAQNRPNFSSRYGWLDISPIQQERMLKPSAIRVHRRWNKRACSWPTEKQATEAAKKKLLRRTKLVGMFSAF